MFKNIFSLCVLSLMLFMVLFLPVSCTRVNAPPSSIGATSPKPADNTLDGEITEIQSDGTILVLQENGRAIYVEPLANTKIIRNAKPAKAGELKVGDAVWVRYMSDFLPDYRKALEIQATGKD
ncbi:MAG: hypothetical protein A2Y81_07830 [Nitrospirae bacterium RBG_13_43_8]|nr:MAG: hypothetical protein A2Y81_07830 [Nitrospirae bacterium RBG_13_43_8]